MQRNTYVEVNIKNLRENIQKIIHKYNSYKHYIGVVKADNYGHCGMESVKAVMEGGCDYLAVATLEEALFIRKEIKDVPILCLGVIPCEYIEECIKNNITITIPSLAYIQELLEKDYTKLKAHLKINTGMNRLGISDSEEIEKIIVMTKAKKIEIEGIYTHIYYANKKEDYQKQLKEFEEIIERISLKNIAMVHIAASEAIVNYEKPSFINTCRIGIMMYGFTKDTTLDLKDTFSVYSEVIQVNTLHKGDVVGYNGIYEAKEDNEKIAVVAIGYADGIIRKNTGRDVYIREKRYPIVGNICMDMLFVKVDENVKIHDKVTILKGTRHIEETAKFLETIPYEVMCSIGKRVKRVYKELTD